MKRSKQLIAPLPRQTPLGQAQGVWNVIDGNGEKVRGHKRSHPDIAAVAPTAAPIAA